MTLLCPLLLFPLWLCHPWKAPLGDSLPRDALDGFNWAPQTACSPVPLQAADKRQRDLGSSSTALGQALTEGFGGPLGLEPSLAVWEGGGHAVVDL